MVLVSNLFAKGGPSTAKLKDENDGIVSFMIEAKITSLFPLEVSFEHAFQVQLIDLYKREGGKYDIKTKQWSFSLTNYDNICKQIQATNKSFKLKALPRFLLDGFKKPRILKMLEACKPESQLLDIEIDEDNVPASLIEKLHPYQQEGVRFIIQRQGRALIGDEMGCGKTIQAITTLAHYRDLWPCLIITPASMRDTWKEELLKWLPDDLQEDDIALAKDGKTPLDAPVCIASYDLVVKMVESKKICNGNYKVVVCDESHSLKSGEAKRTQKIVPLLKSAEVALCITGTPALNRPQELFQQLNSILPELFSDKMGFEVRYCNAHQGKFGWDCSGSSNESELKLLLNNLVMIRRLKKDVLLKKLPTKCREYLFADIKSDEQKKIHAFLKQLKDLESRISSASAKDRDILERERQGLISNLRQKTGIAKIDFAISYIGKILSNHDKISKSANTHVEGDVEMGNDGTFATTVSSKSKIVVFAHHGEVMDKLQEAFNNMGHRMIRIDGRTTVGKRHDILNTFKVDDEIRIALLGIEACGVGLTITQASTAVFVELNWVPGKMIQAEDRIHRIGQLANRVEYHYILARDTLDEQMWKSLQKKTRVLSNTLTSGREEGDETKGWSVLNNPNPTVVVQQSLDKFVKKTQEHVIDSSNELRDGLSYLQNYSACVQQSLDKFVRKMQEGAINPNENLTDKSLEVKDTAVSSKCDTYFNSSHSNKTNLNATLAEKNPIMAPSKNMTQVINIPATSEDFQDKEVKKPMSSSGGTGNNSHHEPSYLSKINPDTESKPNPSLNLQSSNGIVALKSTTTTSLSPETLKRIEENRLKALEKKRSSPSNQIVPKSSIYEPSKGIGLLSRSRDVSFNKEIGDSWNTYYKPEYNLHRTKSQPVSSTALSPSILKRIEENRLKALEKKERASPHFAKTVSSSPVQPIERKKIDSNILTSSHTAQKYDPVRAFLPFHEESVLTNSDSETGKDFETRKDTKPPSIAAGGNQLSEETLKRIEQKRLEALARKTRNASQGFQQLSVSSAQSIGIIPVHRSLDEDDEYSDVISKRQRI